ncbi:MAG: FliA/WhiG family RNA polymerase sigma factor [Desulfobacteraceae bacterium]|nr:FliA/WhiG family RNA polymerase sigma factor [Desulfobacteraceae bacterium]
MEQFYTTRKASPLPQDGEACTAQAEKERAILEHSDLVKYIALRLVSRLPDHIAIEDLMSAGTLGLIDAIEKYDSSQGIPFEYYAKIRIKGAMLDEIRSMDWVPRSLRQKSSLMEKTSVALEQRLGRDATEEEIAVEMNVSMDEFHKMLDEIKGISFLPENIHEIIRENRESHMLASGSEELFDSTYRKEIQKHLAEAIISLSEKEQLVLSLYYYDELTMKEIGVTLGYTESRISQIHTKAVLKLKTKLAKKLRPEDLPGYISQPELRPAQPKRAQAAVAATK